VKPARSIAGRIAWVATGVGAGLAALGALLGRHADGWLGVMGIALIGGALAVGLALWQWRRGRDQLDALKLALERLADADFSAQLALPRTREIAELVDLSNTITESLRRDRQRLYQRELLLDTIVQLSPAALVLADLRGHIVVSNPAARRALANGQRIEGTTLEALLAEQPEALRTTLATGAESISTLLVDGQPELHHASRHRFQLNAQAHTLLMLTELTQPLGRQEVETWKRAIRVISHELNNALAPIKSLAHSGQRLLEGVDADPRLASVLQTIESRAQQLAEFTHRYAEFARLPQPRFERVALAELLESAAALRPFKRIGDTAAVDLRVDRAQIELVLQNLLKNAHESGSAPADVSLYAHPVGGQLKLSVRDRGTGFSEAALKQALLPFFSTKTDGTGLGLALVREIIDAHGGRVSIGNRAGGGAEVTLTLPIEVTT
jgi:two-component system, NtrC family, nitrogen regulation sensor histidine kinase NtrY